MPAPLRRASASASRGAETSLKRSWHPAQFARYREIESYRDFGRRVAPPPARKDASLAERLGCGEAPSPSVFSSPRSCGVRSSTEPEIVAHRTSKRRRKTQIKEAYWPRPSFGGELGWPNYGPNRLGRSVYGPPYPSFWCSRGVSVSV